MSHVLTPKSHLVSPSNQPSTPTAHKRKATSRNDTGLKWFKGSPKKSSQKYRLLKSAPEDPAPPPLPPTLAARVVEFDIDGTIERLGVTERLEIVEKGSIASDLLVDDSGSGGVTLPHLPRSPCGPGRKPRVKIKSDKVKGKKNGKVLQTPSLDPCLKDSSPKAPLPEATFSVLEEVDESRVFDRPNAYIRYMEATQEELSDEVEYDLEEEDVQWLQLTNAARRKNGFAAVKRQDMEFMMDRLEKESYFQMQSTGMDHGPPIDDDAVCCICMDGECQNSNAILFCDMCNLAVHQDCYGVPYIPEGQWLCRKCLHSPSRAVECVLCPNKGGALKGTDDGRWAHVACAIWIPEVCFANTVFLEPIESISNIPAARWRLTCFICKQKGIGACIQCYKSSCYTAFHVTCAQQANLVMKMETVREMHMTSVIIKKTAYCNNHAPPEMLLEKKMKDGVEVASPRMKMKQTRKILAEKRDAVPAVLIPTIPKNRVIAISNSVNFPGKPAFVKRLMAYWKLKRQLRNGVPLLRRLQMASSAPNTKPSESKPKTRVEQEEQLDHYKSWVRLRQDLERARLLCEMIRKREKLKREFIYTRVKVSEMELFPMKAFFLNILDEISERDSKEIFHFPVDLEEVADYSTKVKAPMDLSTMKDKVKGHEYTSLEGVESDFNLMIANCLLYNDKDTIYYKTALRIRAFGSSLFRKAKKTFQSVGYDGSTGFHSTGPTTTNKIPSTKAPPPKLAPTKAPPPKLTPTKTTPPKLLPTKSTSPKVTPPKTTPTKATPTKATPTKATPTKTTTTKATPISEPVTCKCQSTVCNNNCKRNSVPTVTAAAPPNIPASFTTYRSGGGDGVDSDSEAEGEPNGTREESESSDESSDSSNSSSSSSAEEEESEEEKAEPPTKVKGQQDAAQSSSSGEESVEVEEEKVSQRTRSSGAVKVKRSSQPKSDPGVVARSLRSLTRGRGTEVKQQNKPRPSRDSESEESSSSDSSAANSPEKNSRRKRLRKRK